jgi:hypothetical protein
MISLATFVDRHPIRQKDCIGDVDSEEDSLDFCFLRAFGGIAFTMQ